MAREEQRIFNRYGVLSFQEAVIHCFDPYSVAANPSKTFWLVKNVTVRFYPDGRLEIEKVGARQYITHAHAAVLVENGVPYLPIGYVDLYDTKLEATLNRQTTIKLPDKLTVEGAIVPYGEDVLANLILAVVEKQQQTSPRGIGEDDVLSALTLPPPEGAGWFKHTAALARAVHRRLRKLVEKNILTYNPETDTYTVRERSAASVVNI